MIGESIRKWGFWTIDFLRGGQIRRHYNDIKNIMNQNDVFTDQYLDDILCHAADSSEYYFNYKNYNNLKDFPLIDKNIIKDKQDKIMSKKYIGRKLRKMSTSGSTGTHFTIEQDQNKRNRVLAEIITLENFVDISWVIEMPILGFGLKKIIKVQ